MTFHRYAASLAVISVAAGCAAHPQLLPVHVSLCRIAPGSNLRILARVSNEADRPIAALTLSTEFYQDFRYHRYTAAAILSKELDPGDTKEVVFNSIANGATQASGAPLRCFISHIRYSDGAVQDAPQS